MTRLQGRDVVLALKLVVSEAHPLSQRDLATALHESAAEVNAGLARLRECRLLDGMAVRREALLGLLVHGVPHVFPAQLGPHEMGLTTGKQAPGILERYDTSSPTYWIWPTYHVTPRRGRRVMPLYRGAARAAADDPLLHQLLALVDILRVGDDRTWDEIAVEELRSRLVIRRSGSPPR